MAGMTEDKSNIIASYSQGDISVWKLDTALGEASPTKLTSIPNPHLTLVAEKGGEKPLNSIAKVLQV